MNGTIQIALLGGSYDPPHIGHLMAAVYVRATLGADEVWLMPSFQHPFGKALAPFEHRVKMCEVMAADLGPWLKVSTVEQSVGADGRTIDTLEYLLPRYPHARFRLVLGSDIVRDLPSWKAWDKIQSLVDVTILHRAGYPEPQAVGPALAQVSSTEIREALEEGRRPEGLVPRKVLDYLEANGLYRS